MGRKGSVRRIAGVVLALALACSTGVAQEDESSKAKQDGKLGKSLARLLERLDLSDVKRQAVKSVLQSHQEAVDALVARELDARAALREAIERRQTDDQAMRDALDLLAAIDREVALERADIASELLPLLNDEQRVRLIRFIISLERGITSIEREGALPVKKSAKIANVSDGEKEQIETVLDASRSSVVSAAASLVEARTVLVVAVLQSDPDRGLVQVAAESATTAAKRLTRAKASTWSSLMDVLADKQRDRFRGYTETLDEQILKRRKAVCLLFLDQL